MKRPIGEFWGEVGYVFVLDPLVIKSILKTIGMENHHAEALIVKRDSEYIEVWEIPPLPYVTEYAYRLK